MVQKPIRNTIALTKTDGTHALVSDATHCPISSTAMTTAKQPKYSTMNLPLIESVAVGGFVIP